MARIKPGGKNRYTGKLGPVVLAYWKDIFYMRTVNRPRTMPDSQPQRDQKLKFALINRFMYDLRELLEITYAGLADRMTGTNAAFKTNYRNIICGAYPRFRIDYSLMLISKGELPNVTIAGAVATTNDIIFRWTDNSGTGMAKPEDCCIAVIYCPVLNAVVYRIGGALRSDESCTLPATAFAGKTIQTWLAFVSANRKDFSNSVYTGEQLC